MWKMGTKIFLWLVIIYIIKSSMATLCTIRNDGHCFYTVNCDVPARINIVPHCDNTIPFITLVINQSPFHNITANFFDTKFDNYVRMFLAVENTWDVIHDFAFSRFKNVVYMDLSDSHIKSIGRAFIGLSQIDSLNLSRNHLEIINPGVFKFSENKSRLYLLDLSFNLLTYLSEDFFANMYNLRKLYLQGNKLTTLGEQYSTNLKNLDYLNLCCTNLEAFNLSLKYFKSLKELDLSYNLLETVDVSEVLTLEMIHLSHNNIQELTFDYFEKFPYLRELDLSYNKLKTISGSDDLTNANDSKPLIRIYLNNNQISFVNETFFITFSNIQCLNLSYNNIIEFKPRTFRYVNILRVLSISNCKLKITRETFQYLAKTVLIDITRNNLTSLDALSFAECTDLRRIEADYNQIRYVDSKKFMELVPSLTRITLLGNPRDDVANGMNVLLEISVGLIVEMGSTISVMLLLVGTFIVVLYLGVNRRVFLYSL